MRLIAAGVPRAEYYDRNAEAQSLNYNSTSVAPHALTQRAAYTVPTGSKAMLETVYNRVQRATAATTGGIAFIFVGYTKSGGSEEGLLRAILAAAENTAGDKEALANGTQMVLQAGDQITLKTEDLSTAGTLMFHGHAKLTQFDA